MTLDAPHRHGPRQSWPPISRGNCPMKTLARSRPAATLLPLVATMLIASMLAAAAAQTCNGPTRKINVGVSVSPPNVVHTTAYVAKELGLFAKHCIDANIIQFDGGRSPAATVALAQGNAFANRERRPVGRGMKVQAGLGLRAARRRRPTWSREGIKTLRRSQGQAALRRRRRRRRLQLAHRPRGAEQRPGSAVDDAQFISQGTAGPAARAGRRPDRRRRAASGGRLPRHEEEARASTSSSRSPS